MFSRIRLERKYYFSNGSYIRRACSDLSNESNILCYHVNIAGTFVRPQSAALTLQQLNYSSQSCKDLSAEQDFLKEYESRGCYDEIIYYTLYLCIVVYII